MERDSGRSLFDFRPFLHESHNESIFDSAEAVEQVARRNWDGFRSDGITLMSKVVPSIGPPRKRSRPTQVTPLMRKIASEEAEWASHKEAEQPTTITASGPETAPIAKKGSELKKAMIAQTIGPGSW